MAKGKKKTAKHYLFEDVLDFLKHNPEKSFNYKQIGSAIELNTDSERLEVIEVLAALKQQGFVIEKELGKFQIKESKQYITGIIDFTSQASAYVSFSETEKDVFIPGKKTRDALQGDLVKVYIYPRRGNGNRKEGEVVDVIKRNRTEFVGTVQISPKFAYVVPDNTKIHVDFYIRSSLINGAKNGQKVQVKLREWKAGENNPSGEITQVFGFPGEHVTEMHAIMAEFGLPEKFPDNVEFEARSLSTQITQSEINTRRDFRNITTFTIDPFDAKDFDDALSLKTLSNGNWEVGVHIADVTHYLKPGTVLDKEAVNRATSVYLVDRCIPMLPEVLSNFVCSLRQDEEKLCFSAVFELNENVEIISEWYGKTIIKSNRRFTYEEVQEIIEGKEGDFKEEIFVLDKLAKKLRDNRMRKGSISFDKAEVKFKLDENGTPLGVFFKTQKDAHKLIEDFMLLANRKVSEFLSKTQGSDPSKNKKQKDNAPLCVYRIHDVPTEEKMSELSGFAARFGHNMQLVASNKLKTAQAINKLLVEVKGKKEQSMIELLAVRSMPKAYYSTKNVGHYGLGFEYYSHFTSPIRRYPDVMLHRLLQARLTHATYSNRDELELLCKQSSEMERLAADAERASVKYKQVEFLKDKIGFDFEGIISGVTEWGIYVEIKENKCEGMVRSRDIKGDYFMFDEENYRYIGRNTGKIYALGDAVKIKVINADLTKKQLTYEFAEDTTSNNQSKISFKKKRNR
ncbi:MAG: ribonuclease R [Bacteroidetes bacterium]|nr:ribonuclease R [Bacteroidota bacterium]